MTAAAEFLPIAKRFGLSSAKGFACVETTKSLGRRSYNCTFQKPPMVPGDANSKRVATPGE